MTTNELLTALDYATVNPRLPADMRQVLAAEANSLRAAINRKVPRERIEGVKDEAERVYKMWVGM